MNPSVMVAVIAASASVAVAALSYGFNLRSERKSSLQQRKVAHYQELFNSLSDLAVDGTDKEAANLRFANAVNTIGLVAPQYVIASLMRFHDEVKYSNPNSSPEGHDCALKEMILAVRKSLDLPFRDDPKTFIFHLIGSSPQ